MGFSAGGHLMGWASACFGKTVYEPVDEDDAVSARPDLSALILPGHHPEGAVRPHVEPPGAGRRAPDPRWPRRPNSVEPHVRAPRRRPSCPGGRTIRRGGRQLPADVLGPARGRRADRDAPVREGRPRLQPRRARLPRRRVAGPVSRPGPDGGGSCADSGAPRGARRRSELSSSAARAARPAPERSARTRHHRRAARSAPHTTRRVDVLGLRDRGIGREPGAGHRQGQGGGGGQAGGGESTVAVARPRTMALMGGSCLEAGRPHSPRLRERAVNDRCENLRRATRIAAAMAGHRRCSRSTSCSVSGNSRGGANRRPHKPLHRRRASSNSWRHDDRARQDPHHRFRQPGDQLIARRVREEGVYSEIVPYNPPRRRSGR